MKRILNRKTVRLFKNESVEGPHEVLLALVDFGSLDAKEVLLACVKEMSDADCKRVLSSLSLASNRGEVEDPEDYMGVDLVPLDDEFVDDYEDEESDKDEESDEDADEEDDADEANESYLKRRQLERRTRRMERLMKNEKGLFNLFSKKKKPAELDLKTFQRIGKDFVVKIHNNYSPLHDPNGSVTVRGEDIGCRWKNGANLHVSFNDGTPNWSMTTSHKAVENSMPRGRLRFVDDRLEFDDPKAWGKIEYTLDAQSEFMAAEIERADKRLAKAGADADAYYAKQDRRKNNRSDNRMNPYTTEWI